MNVKKSQIKQLRLQYGMEEICRVSGYTKRQIYNFENGTTPMRKVTYNGIRAELEKAQ